MPYGKKKQDGKFCVYKKDGGKVLHCHDNEKDADDYLAALYMHADKELAVNTDAADIFVTKEADGRYRIVAVSTAALPDREGETFDTMAMDYDAAFASRTKDFPEFRVFHKSPLGIGRVDKMSRVGIFAVDEGYSYTDPFSLDVCEKMLVHNDGKWKISRGFFVLEASGACPSCGEGLLVRQKHMTAGFSCPTCKSMYLDYKGVLKDVHFRQTKTFDITVTDNPAVPWTGVAAFRGNTTFLEDNMNKKQLKEKLLAAGLDESAVDERLAKITDAQLKEYSDVPMAVLLKELDKSEEPEDEEDMEDEEESEDVPEEDKEYVDMDVLLKEFAGILDRKLPALISKQIVETMSNFELQVDEPEMKELPDITELREEVAELKEMLGKLLEKDETRLKELLDDMPRSSKLRVKRYKAEEEEDDEPVVRRNKQSEDSAVIVDADGRQFRSMTELIAVGGE